MSVAKKHAVLLAAFLVFGGHAQAQFKGVAEPVPAMPVAQSQRQQSRLPP